MKKNLRLHIEACKIGINEIVKYVKRPMVIGLWPF